uniref:BEN domain-containing protein n=1 Tax=Trichogramma kaykai TaxID=54128 RepID=A0ABD2WHG1_9HYME
MDIVPRTRGSQSLIALASSTGEYPGAELRRSSADTPSSPLFGRPRVQVSTWADVLLTLGTGKIVQRKELRHRSLTTRRSSTFSRQVSTWRSNERSTCTTSNSEFVVRRQRDLPRPFESLDKASKKRLPVTKLNDSNVNESLNSIILDESSASHDDHDKQSKKAKRQLVYEMDKSILKEKNLPENTDTLDGDNGPVNKKSKQNTKKVNKKATSNTAHFLLDDDTTEEFSDELDDGTDCVPNNEENELNSCYKTNCKQRKNNSDFVQRKGRTCHATQDFDHEEDFDEDFNNADASNEIISKSLGSNINGRKDGDIWKKVITKNDKTFNLMMLHLGKGYSIPVSNWEYVKETSNNRSMFIKNLARALYGTEKLANRCVVEVPNMIKATKRDSPRKVFTPNKVKVMKSCYRVFLTKIKPSFLHGKDLAVVLNEITTILSDEVAYQIKCYKTGSVKDKKPFVVEEEIDLHNEEDDDSYVYEEDLI